MANFEFKNENEIKIFILHILRNLPRPVTFNELNDMIRQDELVNYVDFAENLAQLVEKGNVRCFHRVFEGPEDCPYYEITERGKYVADTLKSEIAGYIRTRSLKSALRYLSFKESGTTLSVKKEGLEDGRYMMTFSIRGREDTPMELNLLVDNEYQADKMEFHFRENPETIYRSILSLLAGDAGFLFG